MKRSEKKYIEDTLINNGIKLTYFMTSFTKEKQHD